MFFVLTPNDVVKEVWSDEEAVAQLAMRFPDLIHFEAEFYAPQPPYYPRKDGPYTMLGPECFTDGDVISYKGENYYRACNVFVADLEDGGQSHCVKRVGHPSKQHEDYDGRTLDE